MPGHVFLGFSTLSLCAAACLLAEIASAGAAVIVLGNSKAHQCYLAAKSGLDVRQGIGLCSQAIDEGEMPSKDMAATHVNRGVLYDAVSRYSEAMDDYNKAMTIEPGLGDAYLNRGVALIRLRKYDDALSDIQKGMSLGVTEQEIGYYDLAVVEEDLGRIKEAYYDYKHVLELAPGYMPASEALKHFTVTRTPGPPAKTPNSGT